MDLGGAGLPLWSGRGAAEEGIERRSDLLSRAGCGARAGRDLDVLRAFRCGEGGWRHDLAAPRPFAVDPAPDEFGRGACGAGDLRALWRAHPGLLQRRLADARAFHIEGVYWRAAG